MTATATVADARNERAALWSLLFANFVIGTGVLLPIGLQNELMRDLGVSSPVIGSLVWSGAIVIGAGAPLAAAITSAIDRRLLLMAALALFAVGHAISAAAPGFTVLLLTRIAMVIAAGIVTPQAASTTGVLVAPERRAAAITFIFLGWSIASVIGIPLASLVGASLGWRVAYLAVAGLSFLALLAIALSVPRGLKVAPLSLASWRSVFTSPALLLVLAVTALSASGQFTVFTYIAPVLREAIDATPTTIAGALAWFGLWGVVGNSLASRVVGRFGAPATVMMALFLMAVGLLIWSLSPFNLMWIGIAAFFWGLGTFASNSLQQARLVGLAPPLASASIALNTSCIYIGQAVGAAAGGAMIAADYMLQLGWLALSFMLAAIAVSQIATRNSTP